MAAATRVDFYHLTRTTLEGALPKLLEKALDSGARVVVMAGSPERVEALTGHLWTYDDRSFLPHGNARDGHAEAQPIWLTEKDENPNEATILVLTDGAVSDRIAEYERCLEIFDGNDPDAVEAARARWGAYRADGLTVAYNQQTESGGWERKT